MKRIGTQGDWKKGKIEFKVEEDLSPSQKRFAGLKERVIRKR